MRKGLWTVPSFSRGFTLAEVLAAMLFMAITIPVAVQGVIIANRAGTVAERKRQAASLADQCLKEQIISDQWRTQAQQEGDFTGDWADFHWALKADSWDTDSTMKIITATVTFRVQGQEYQVSVSTLALAEAPTTS
jgi:type II secretory pathway pseudopilin PulG